MPHEPTPLTVRQAAEQLDVPVGWLKAEAAAGRVPCLKIGRRMLFNADAVRRVLLARAAEQPEGKETSPSP